MPSTLRLTSLLLAAMLMAPAIVAAQLPDDRFVLRVNAFQADTNLRFFSEGTVSAGERSLDYSGSEDVDIGKVWRPRASFEYRFANRHSIVANAYDYRRSRSDQWGGGELVIPDGFGLDQGSIDIPELSVRGDLTIKLASLNYAYDMISTERFRWGVGVGLAYAYLRGRADAEPSETNQNDTGSVSHTWKRAELAPGVHSRFTWSPADRWHIGGEGQYFDTRWGNFVKERGHFERAGLIVEYMVTRHLGVHVGYDWFRLKLADDFTGSVDAPDEIDDIDTIDINGRLGGDLKTHGPLIGATFRF